MEGQKTAIDKEEIQHGSTRRRIKRSKDCLEPSPENVFGNSIPFVAEILLESPQLLVHRKLFICTVPYGLGYVVFHGGN